MSAGSVRALVALFALAVGLHGQNPPAATKEYIYFNGRLVVLETPSINPSTPALSGSCTWQTGTSCTFTTGGSNSTGCASMQYLFDWGDGTNSGWLGNTSASHSWTAAGSYWVTARARCATDPTSESGSSSGFLVTVTGGLTVTPNFAVLAGVPTQAFTGPAGLAWNINPAVGSGSIDAGLFTLPARIAGESTATVTVTGGAGNSVSKILMEPGVDLALPYSNIGSGVGVYRAANNISVNSGFNINGAANVTFSAGNQIRLEPGFRATAGTAGTTFHAVIGAVAPTGQLSASSTSFAAAGGSGLLNIQAPAGTNWTVSGGGSGWIQFTSATSGAGLGSVSYTIASNSSTASRSGQLTITGITAAPVTITQAGTPPPLSASPSELYFQTGMGTSSVVLTATEGLNWTTNQAPSWLTVSPASGTGPQILILSAAANSGGNRSFTLQISAGTNSTSVVVVQAGNGTGNSITLSPAAINFQSGTGSTTVALTSTAGLNWTVNPAPPSWLTVSPPSGTGSQNLTVSVTANSGASRNAAIQVSGGGAGATASVTQAGPTLPPVTVSVSPVTVTLQEWQTQQFTAAVTGTTNTGVTWSTNPPVGSMSSTGLYTPPLPVSSAQTVVVTATSNAAPVSGTATASLVADVVPAVVSVSPSSGTDSSATFTYSMSDVNGYQDALDMQVFITGPLGYSGPFCHFYLQVVPKLIYLTTDSDVGWVNPSGSLLGSGSPVSNTRCTINPSASSWTGSGNSYSLSVNVSFSSLMQGTLAHQVTGSDKGGLYPPLLGIGSWVVP